MSETRLLANRIKRTVIGPMWHGPSLFQLLEAVTCEQATVRPAMSVHNIWELVLHIITWVDVPLERLGGSARKDVTTEEDWPTPPNTPSEAAWRATIARLEQRHRALAAAVRDMTDDQLDAIVAGHEYTVREMLHGVVEHGTYHGGQIAVLKKLVAR
ncbi:MAG TPA: DinB family protein [Gemmatimonadaceae bacterium]|nr:DinB family protein [Gemmatimonadaceae bacterium]